MAGSWRKIALAKSKGEKTDLSSLDNECWVIPKKLSLDVMTEMTESQDIDFSKVDAEGKTPEQIEAEVKKLYASKGDKKTSLGDKSFRKMLKLAFLNGIHDHNFEITVNKENVLISEDILEGMSDDDFNEKIKSGEYKTEKIEWNEKLYEQLLDYHETLFEIFKVVMDFNRPLAKKTSKK